MSFWDFLWLIVWSYFFVMYLVLMFHIVADLFRDPELGGVAKAVWLVGLIVMPFLIALVYLIVRGRDTAERQMDPGRPNRAQTDQYIQSLAVRTDPATQISSAKGLLDDGTISPSEFERLKAKALA